MFSIFNRKFNIQWLVNIMSIKPLSQLAHEHFTTLWDWNFLASHTFHELLHSLHVHYSEATECDPNYYNARILVLTFHNVLCIRNQERF